MSLNSFIAKQFSDPSGIGGKLVSFVMNRQNRPLYDETIRLLAPANTDSVLDIGCGNGYVMNMLARQSDCRFTGVDTSESIIRDAKRRNHKLVNNGRMEFLCQDVSSMPFADSSFSKVYTINTVYFWQSLDSTLSEIRRVLKPNGLFINTLYSNDALSQFSHTKFGYKRFTVEQLTKAGNDVGFAVNVMPVMDNGAYSILYHKTK